MPKLSQVSFGRGEISRSLSERSDLQMFAAALRTCRNFFVRPTGGVSNRAGLQFVQALDPDSEANLIPFIYSTDIAYMIAFQHLTAQPFFDGSFVQDIAGGATITNVQAILVGSIPYYRVDTSGAHGFVAGDTVTVSGVVGLGVIDDVNAVWSVFSVPIATRFIVGPAANVGTGYTSGGLATLPEVVTSPYESEDLAALRYTQSADVLTLAHQAYPPNEFVRNSATDFDLDEITDFEGGPFLDENKTATTMQVSASTGTITITASTSVFTAAHVGALIRLTAEDLSGYKPWEPNKFIAAGAADPDGEIRYYNGKVYVATGNAVALASGTYTGTKPPTHEEGIELDGDLGLYNGTANTRAGVYWEYLHSFSGIARITAQAGTTATAEVRDYMPASLTSTPTTKWAFGAWSEDQGYPKLCTYFADRLVFANTPGQPQTEWASQVGDYHNFHKSNPLEPADAITQRLNARQINAIQEIVPADQLVTLTSSSSWASPKRGETWTPTTIGYDPQSFDGSADLRSILTGDSILFAQRGATKIRELMYGLNGDKFSGPELTILARHLFEDGKTIVDMDYAKEPHGILWIVRSDGALIGLTYLREQEVIGWHRHDTQGYFERVCVIPENGIDTPYFVVRRTVNGQTVRYLERMAVRDQADILDSFFVDSGLTYDGRNDTATTVRISGASYDGGQSVTLTASADLFSGSSDIGDMIQFPYEAVLDDDDVEVTPAGKVRALITGYTSATQVTALLQSPVPAELQNVATTTWTFARDTFAGLGHLEGEEVSILADGSPVDGVNTVENGSISLAVPAGVVHIGLRYNCDIETLDVTIFGASESIRDNAKCIPQVSVITERTLGLTAGPDAAHLHDIGYQPTDFDYNSPWPLQSDVQKGYMQTTWDKSGRVLIRQDNPLPATILAVLPQVEVGANG